MRTFVRAGELFRVAFCVPRYRIDRVLESMTKVSTETAGPVVDQKTSSMRYLVITVLNSLKQSYNSLKRFLMFFSSSSFLHQTHYGNHVLCSLVIIFLVTKVERRSQIKFHVYCEV
jgi:hypothetical protein